MSKFFMIGINGAGMSALACILKKLGNEVIGSDSDEEFFTQQFLNELDIKKYKFNDFDFNNEYFVIVGNSFSNDFSEVIKATQQGNEMLYYYEYLGLMSKEHNSVAVAGTHGKTTTTTMLTKVLGVNNNVNYLIGDGHGNASLDAKYFVFEACEYKNHFHSYYPTYAIITNVGYDHVDFFKSEEEYRNSFIAFANNVSKNVIVCGDDEVAYDMFKGNSKVVFYGTNDYCDIAAKNIVFSDHGTKFDIYINNQYILTYNTVIYGMHNILNLLSTLTVAYLSGDDIEQICLSYNGSISPKRRFEEYFYEEQVIVDDYAHHPDELRSFLDAVFQKYHNRNIIAVFEPHTVERLIDHSSEFAKQLNRCNEQFVLPVKIPLRDMKKYENGHVESDIMLSELNNGSFYSDDMYDYLLSKKGDVVLFIGATVSSYLEVYIGKCNLQFNKI